MSLDTAPRARLTEDQKQGIRDRNPVHEVAAQWVKLRKRPKRIEYDGPCPICSRNPQSKTDVRFRCTADGWMCAVCRDGGDVFELVCKVEGVDFVRAIERLGGEREEVITDKVAERRGGQAFRVSPCAMPPAPFGDAALDAAFVRGFDRAAKAEAGARTYRERERLRLYNFWRQGAPIAGTPVAVYLRRRGLMWPDNVRLKFHPSMPLFCDGREREPVLAHRGPAMLAAIIGADGKFCGLHITWLDPAGPKGKALVHNPETGEVLPSKKSRGSKAGGYIDLGGAADGDRMIAGEGIETVLAIYTALVRLGRDVSRIVWRCGIDMGNLCGSAIASVPHPTLKTDAGRVRKVPGAEPDLTSAAMPVPDTIADLLLLGDGDSDPFTTRNAMTRARRRNERPGRTVRVKFSPDGIDFDDMMQGNLDNE